MKIKYITIIVVISLLLFMTGCGLFSSRDDFEGLQFCEYLNEEGPNHISIAPITDNNAHAFRPINITDAFEPGSFYAHLGRPDGFNPNKLTLEVYKIEGEDKTLYHEESIELGTPIMRHKESEICTSYIALYYRLRIQDRGEYIIRFNDSDGDVFEEGNVTIR